MEKKENYERQPAKIVSIKNILESKYYEVPGWEPNFIIIKNKIKANRINIIGVIISENEESGFKNYYLEDTTGNILLKSFEEEKFKIKTGDIVLVIGKPRKYNDSFYIIPEIIKKTEKKWYEYRIKELKILEEKILLMKEIRIEKEKIIEKNKDKENSEEKKEKNIIEENKKSDSEIIYDLIKENDQGNGADLFLILKLAEKKGIKNAEKNIHLMLELGDVFEIKTGKLKVL